MQETKADFGYVVRAQKICLNLDIHLPGVLATLFAKVSPWIFELSSIRLDLLNFDK